MRKPFQRKSESKAAAESKAGSRKRERVEPAQQFAEIWGEAMVAARHLRVGTAALAALCLALAAGWCTSAGRRLKPIVIRVDEIGRAEAVRYEAVEANSIMIRRACTPNGRPIRFGACSVVRILPLTRVAVLESATPNNRPAARPSPRSLWSRRTIDSVLHAGRACTSEG